MSHLSPVDICNQALGWVGATLITSQEFDSPSSKEAELCLANYAPLRDAVLEDHPWSFAIKRAVLAPLSQTNKGEASYLYGGNNQFQLPGEILRILDVAKNSGFTEFDLLKDYTLEDRKIIAPFDLLYVRSIYRVTDTGKMSVQFTQTVAARMAMDLSIPLTNSRTMYESMTAMYQFKLASARTVDGLQGTNRRITSSWIRRARSR